MRSDLLRGPVSLCSRRDYFRCRTRRPEGRPDCDRILSLGRLELPGSVEIAVAGALTGFDAVELRSASDVDVAVRAAWGANLFGGSTGNPGLGRRDSDSLAATSAALEQDPAAAAWPLAR
jgi:hypothetical protein